MLSVFLPSLLRSSRVCALAAATTPSSRTAAAEMDFMSSSLEKAADMLLPVHFVAQRKPHRARHAGRNELLRNRRGRIESAAGAGKEVAAKHAEALVTPIEEIVHLERDFPVAARPVAGERLGDRVARQRAMDVPVVFVPARILAAEPGPAQAERSSPLWRPVERELHAVLRDSRDRIAALHGDLIGGVVG